MFSGYGPFSTAFRESPCSASARKPVALNSWRLLAARICIRFQSEPMRTRESQSISTSCTGTAPMFRGTCLCPAARQFHAPAPDPAPDRQGLVPTVRTLPAPMCTVSPGAMWRCDVVASPGASVPDRRECRAAALSRCRAVALSPTVRGGEHRYRLGEGYSPRRWPLASRADY